MTKFNDRRYNIFDDLLVMIITKLTLKINIGITTVMIWVMMVLKITAIVDLHSYNDDDNNNGEDCNNKIIRCQ